MRRPVARRIASLVRIRAGRLRTVRARASVDPAGIVRALQRAAERGR